MDPLAVGVEEAAKLCGFGAKLIYTLIKEDSSFPAFAIGERDGRYIIPVDELRRWLNERGRLRVGLKATSSPIAKLIDASRKKRA